MQIKDFNNVKQLAPNDLFLIQKNDKTSEYCNISTDDLVAITGKNQGSVNNVTYVGNVEPTPASNGFTWKETTDRGFLVEDWVRYNNQWISSLKEVFNQAIGNKSSLLWYPIDKRYDLKIVGYELIVGNLTDNDFDQDSEPATRVSLYQSSLNFQDGFRSRLRVSNNSRSIRSLQRKVEKKEEYSLTIPSSTAVDYLAISIEKDGVNDTYAFGKYNFVLVRPENG